MKLTPSETQLSTYYHETSVSRDKSLKPPADFVYILNAPYISALLVTVLDVLNSKDLGVVCQPCGCVDGILGTLGST